MKKNIPRITPFRALASVFMTLAAAPFTSMAKEPSAQSVETLLSLSNAQTQFEVALSQINEITDSLIEAALESPELDPEQKETFKKQMPQLKAKIQKVVTDELGWQALKASYAKLYKKAFTQEEVDGMIAFFQSQSGKAFVKKMPVLRNACTQVAADRLPYLAQKIREISAQIPKESSQRKP